MGGLFDLETTTTTSVAALLCHQTLETWKWQFQEGHFFVRDILRLFNDCLIENIDLPAARPPQAAL